MRSRAAWHTCSCALSCAGQYPDGWEPLGKVMRGVASLCTASVPLAVELFCRGTLGVLVRIVQRWVRAQPRGRWRGTISLVENGLVRVTYAFGVAVPQARAHLVPRPAA